MKNQTKEPDKKQTDKPQNNSGVIRKYKSNIPLLKGHITHLINYG